MRKYIFTLVFCFYNLSIHAQVIESVDARLFQIITAENDTIDFLKTNTDIDIPKPTILFCQGSLPIPLIISDNDGMFIPSISNFEYWNFTKKINTVVISMPHIPPAPPKNQLNNRLQYVPDPLRPNDFDTLYLKNDYLEKYVERAECVLRYLEQQKWVDKDKIMVVGHSQGSTIALKLAEKNPNIRALGYFAGNPAGRFTNYIRNARRFRTKEKTTSSEMQQNINELYSSWREILANKADDEIQKTAPAWISFTLPMWNNLIELKTPIFVAYGTDDLDSAESSELLPIYFDKYGKKNYKMYPVVGCGHNFEKINDDGNSDWDDMSWYVVMREFINWVETIKN